MAIISPFEGLELDKDTVCEFFAVFARFEFSLKELNFFKADRGVVSVSWRSFAENIASGIVCEEGSKLYNSIIFLINEPPLIQTGKSNWEHRELYGSSDISRAIDAATRVRHNLFHGGKHTPHSPPGRDQRLIESSLTVLYACLEHDKELRDTYEQNVF